MKPANDRGSDCIWWIHGYMVITVIGAVFLFLLQMEK